MSYKSNQEFNTSRYSRFFFCFFISCFALFSALITRYSEGENFVLTFDTIVWWVLGSSVLTSLVWVIVMKLMTNNILDNLRNERQLRKLCTTQRLVDEMMGKRAENYITVCQKQAQLTNQFADSIEMSLDEEENLEKGIKYATENVALRKKLYWDMHALVTNIREPGYKVLCGSFKDYLDEDNWPSNTDSEVSD